MTTKERQQTALNRAQSGLSLINYPAIISGFAARGIPEDQIRPRENVFTFDAWKAQGRFVRKGEHGVKVITRVPITRTVDEEDGTGPHSAVVGTRPWSTTVFHVSQTEPAGTRRTE